MKLLIVDDERATRTGLTTMIPWADLGIDQVYAAADGAEALDLCRLTPPDILLTDIRMIGMTGIELARHVHQLYPECAIVFLSGYSDKEYLQAAIHLSAVDYIEKPVTPAAVQEVMVKAVHRVRQEKSHREHAQLDAMLSQNLPAIRQKTLLQLISSHGEGWQQQANLRLLHCFPDQDMWYNVYIVRMRRPVERMDAFEYAFSRQMAPVISAEYLLYAFKDARHFLAVAASGHPRQLAADSPLAGAMARMSLDGVEKFIAVGQPVQGLSHLPEAYMTAAIVLQSLFYKGFGACAGYMEGMGEAEVSLDSEQFVAAIKEKLTLMDREGTQAMLKELYLRLSSSAQPLPSLVRSLYFRLCSLLVTLSMPAVAQEGEPPEAEDLWQGISDCPTLAELHSYLDKRVDAFFAQMSGKGEGSRSVTRMMKYIHLHFADPELSVRAIAAAVYLTPTYASNLFKKETGQTIKQYITEYRINQSLPYLMDDAYKLYQVALMVGYTDANYYARIFRKVMGKTPSEYKEQCTS